MNGLSDYWQNVLDDCVRDGEHLLSCDRDGYCNNCGLQDHANGCSCEHCEERRDDALRRVAQEVTDEVMGQGAFARANNLAPALTIQEEPDGR